MLFVVVAAVSLASCSGKKGVCTTNCGGGGTNATLNLTISDTPPTGVTVLSFTLPISGISLTPSSGSPVSVYSGGSFELTRLQSDTAVVALAVSVPTGTYTAINVNLGTSSGVFINASTASIGTCVAGHVCALPSGAATQITIPISLTLSGGEKQWADLDFNLDNAITSTSGITVDFTQKNVLTALTTPPTGIPSGDTANIDDFTGSVTALSASSITVTSSVRGALTASLSSSVTVNDPQNQCTGGGSLSCIGKGSIVSLQGVLTTAGVVNATSLDVIDKSTTPADEVEGTIYPSTCNGGSNFGLILSDSVIFTSGSPLASAGYGAGVCLKLSQAPTFAIDDGILTGQAGVPTLGFSSSADMVPGQTVRAKITGAATGTNGSINATATALILRFSRFTATVGTISGNAFQLTTLPAYMGTFTVTPQVATYPNATLLEGVTTVSNLTFGQTVSVSTLYLNPATNTQFPFQAAKVRSQ